MFAACVAKVREEGTDGNTARRDDDEGRGLAHTSISFSFSFLLADVLHKVFSLRAYKNATVCTSFFSCKLARQVQSSIWKHASLFQDSGGCGSYKQCQSNRFLQKFLICLNFYSQCAAMVMAVVVSSASAGKGKRINCIFIKRKSFQ